jgi:hypothetical protein
LNEESHDDAALTRDISPTAARCWFIRLAQTGTWAAASLYPGAALLSWKSRVFSFILHSKLKELAEWFGVELARIVVDECMPAPANI